MKKLTALALSAGMLFSLVGCGGSKVSDEALDAFEVAIQNIADMKSADYDLKMDIEQDKNTGLATISGSYNFETADPQFSMKMSLSSGGAKIDNYAQMYLNKDGMYTNMMNQLKTKSPIEDSLKAMPSFSLDKETMKVPKEELKKYLKEASLDGNNLTLEFDTDKIKEEMNSLSKLNPTVSAAASALAVEEFKMVITLKDKKIANADLDISMSQTEKNETTTMKAKVVLAFKNVGANKKVVFPKDLNTYVEDTSGLLGSSGL